MTENPVLILAIESSCDETAAAVSRDNVVLSNVIAGQAIHEAYGGIVPELASRAHQKNIIPVVDRALREADVTMDSLDAVAYTNGPGLIGSLMVGSSFAKALSFARGLPAIGVNHMQAHVLAHFARAPGDAAPPPAFPFLCLTVSGGHTQLVRVDGHTDMHIVGRTLDDAAGEAFDKIAKILGLPYPGGPLIDKLAEGGDPLAFSFPKPSLGGLDFSFSGLKTSVLYFIQKQTAADPEFIGKHTADLCASVQHTIVEILMHNLVRAADRTGIREVALAGGVSANRALRAALVAEGRQHGWRTHVPPFAYCTDNAAMVAVTGYFKFLQRQFAAPGDTPFARFNDF